MSKKLHRSVIPKTLLQPENRAMKVSQGWSPASLNGLFYLVEPLRSRLKKLSSVISCKTMRIERNFAGIKYINLPSNNRSYRRH